MVAKKSLTAVKKRKILNDILLTLNFTQDKYPELYHLIQIEFQRGRKSPLNSILESMNSTEDIAKLLSCIGTKILEQDGIDPLTYKTAVFLRDHAGVAIDIFNGNSSEKLITKMDSIVQHFVSKLKNFENIEDVSMIMQVLESSKKNIKFHLLKNNLIAALEHQNIFKDKIELNNSLLCFWNSYLSFSTGEQSEFCIQELIDGFKYLSIGFKEHKLLRVANIVESSYWLLNIACRVESDNPRVINFCMSRLGIEFGNATVEELTQNLLNQDSEKDKNMLQATRMNQKLACTAHLLYKMGKETSQKSMQDIALVGISFCAMQQISDEVKYENLNTYTIAESVGVVCDSVGELLKVKELNKIGLGIRNGLELFNNLSKIPGAQAIALPLAALYGIKSVFSKSKHKHNTQAHISSQQIMQNVFNMYKDLKASNQAYFRKIDQKIDFISVKIDVEMTRVNTKILEFGKNNSIEFINLENKIGDMIDYNEDNIHNQFVNQSYSKFRYYKKYKLDIFDSLFVTEQTKIKDFIFEVYNYILINIIEEDKVINVENTILHYKNAHNKLYTASSVANLLLGLIEYGEKLEIFSLTTSEISTLHSYVKTKIEIYNKLLSFEYKSLVSKVCAEIMDNYNDLYLETLAIFPVKKTLQKIAKINNENQYEKIADSVIDLSTDRIDIPKLSQSIQYALSINVASIEYELVISKNNSFLDPHVSYGDNSLGDRHRDIIFELNSYFVCEKNKVLINTTHYAYDLHTSKRRHDEYYLSKFFWKLEHKGYKWINVYGNAADLEIHGAVAWPQRNIDYSSLTRMYSRMFNEAKLINDVSFNNRLDYLLSHNLPYKTNIQGQNRCDLLLIEVLGKSKSQFRLDLHTKMREFKSKMDLSDIHDNIRIISLFANGEKQKSLISKLYMELYKLAASSDPAYIDKFSTKFRSVIDNHIPSPIFDFTECKHFVGMMNSLAQLNEFFLNKLDKKEGYVLNCAVS